MDETHGYAVDQNSKKKHIHDKLRAFQFENVYFSQVIKEK